MEITLSTPTPATLDTIIATLALWQSDNCSNHIHPGDIGWFQRFGADKTASSLRTWTTADGTILGVGLLDGEDLLRATIAPSARRNKALAKAMATDITDPARGVLPPGMVYVDISPDTLVREQIAALDGWLEGELWTWLRMSLASDEPVNRNSNLLIEIVETEEQIRQRVDIQSLAFGKSNFTVDKWHAMAAGFAYKTACCLLAFDKGQGEAIGAVTTWSAGSGKPGILEPVGVSASHQGRGIGKSLCRAAADELRRKGASSVMVATPTSNAAAVAAYQGAGFTKIGEYKDIYRRK